MLVCLATINLQTTNKKVISQYLLKSIAGHQKVNRMKELNAVEVQDINGGIPPEFLIPGINPPEDPWLISFCL